jgi:hypothetical protein
MGTTRALHHGIIIAIGKFAIVVVAVIGCLFVGALSLDAHNDWLLVVAALSAAAALSITVLGAIWIFRGVRTLIRATEK